jgi:hypothetical protein
MVTKKTKTKARKNNNNGNFVYKSTNAPLVSHVSDLVNPFSPGAVGKKIHDSNSARTFTLQSRTNHVMTCNTVGMGYVEIYPTLNNQLTGVDTSVGTALPTTGIVGATPATSSTDAADFSLIDDASKKFRIVSMGIRIVSTQAALNAQGRVIIKVLDKSLIYNNTVAVGVNTFLLGEESYTESINANTDLTIIPPNNGNEYFNYLDPEIRSVDFEEALGGGGFSNTLNYPYRPIGITISGCTTGTNELPVFNIEVVMNLELLPTIDKLSARIATEAAPHSTQILEAVHNTRARTPTTSPSSTMGSKVWAVAKHVAGNLATKGFNALTSYLTGGMAPRITYGPHQTPVLEVD